DFNLKPGQPLRYRRDTDAALEGFTLQPPGGAAKPLAAGLPTAATYPAQLIRQPHGTLLVYERTRETGVYRLETPESQPVYYVVQPDTRESDLTPCTPDELEKVKEVIKVEYKNERTEMVEAQVSVRVRHEVWWCFLLGLIALLCAEVWMTRRLVKNR